jgi:hypothetical protein
MTKFDGSDYVPERDDARLSSQLKRVFNVMKDGGWRSLETISLSTGDPEPSVSAQLRHLRKPKHGSHTVNKKHMGEGLYVYQLLVAA